MQKRDKESDLSKRMIRKKPMPHHSQSQARLENTPGSRMVSPGGTTMKISIMGETGTTHKRGGGPQSKQLIYRDLSERVTRLTRTPSDLWQELQGMGSSQIMKRHMWNRSMNNA